MYRDLLPPDPQKSGYRFIPLLVLFFIILIALPSAFAALPESKSELLQFTADKHVLGFEHNAVYVAGGNHMLKVEFAGTPGVLPVSDGAVNGKSGVQPLNLVTYNQLWPGIDLVYESVHDGIVTSTWEIAPGIAPEQIRLRYNAPVEIETGGNLKISYANGWMLESAPIAWQEIDGQRNPVEVTFLLLKDSGGEPIIGFDVGRYDPALPLLIDPTLEWNTFIGSADYRDGASAITVDRSGNIYVAGYSRATWGTPVNAYNGFQNGFVAKLNSSGALVWNTFMGPAGSVSCSIGDIVVDSIGNIYVAGESRATWGTPINAYAGGLADGFVAKLSNSGALTWHTFMGSADSDGAGDIAVDAIKVISMWQVIVMPPGARLKMLTQV